MSWIVWPSKAVCKAAEEKMRSDPRWERIGEMPFDGKRMFWSGFEVLLDAPRPSRPAADGVNRAMALDRIYAQLSCTDISAGTAWYEQLFGRSPDSSPMDGLVEWHHRDAAGLQLFENADDAGHGTLTLVVEGLRGERDRLERAGLAPGDVEPATAVSIVRLRDPDGNLIVLAESTVS